MSSLHAWNQLLEPRDAPLPYASLAIEIRARGVDGPDFLSIHRAEEAELAAVDGVGRFDVELDEVTGGCQFWERGSGGRRNTSHRQRIQYSLLRYGLVDDD